MTDPDITDLDPIFAQWAQEKLRKRFRRPKYKTLVAVDTKDLSFNKCGETEYHKERGTEDIITCNEVNDEFENNSDTVKEHVITAVDTTKSSYEWSQTKGYKLSASASVNVGIPTVGGLTAKGGVEFQLFERKTKKRETEDSHGHQTTVDVQPWSKVRVSIETKKKVHKMDFSLSVYLQGKVSVEMKKESGKTKAVTGDVVDIMQEYGKGTVETDTSGKRGVRLSIKGTLEGMTTIDRKVNTTVLTTKLDKDTDSTSETDGMNFGARTAPVEGKSRFPRLGRFFKPWTWRRKEENQKFKQTSKAKIWHNSSSLHSHPQLCYFAGVRKYFYYIKKKVSSDWKDLAFHLGLEQPDIDNIDGRNRDDKSCCMDLLEEWLKRNGERATIEVLMEALSEANLQSVVDGLRKDFPGKKFPVPVRAAGTESVKLSVTSVIPYVFQKSVKRYYELKLCHFKPLIWNDNFTLDLSDIFTQLELVQTSTRKELKSLDNLFKPDVTGLSTAPRCILIEGEAGGGKTTFLSKEALDAVSQKTELGRRHDIVLLIRLREVREGETIEEMVWDQCVDEATEGIDVQSIRAILQRNESHVLFLLDGYDELRTEARAAGQAIPKLLSGKIYTNSAIVITSRPSAGVQQYTRPDCHVHIMGFSEEHVEKYMQQYFTVVGKQELTKALAVQVKDNNLSNTLIHAPIFLMFVCVLWEEDQEMVSTGTMTGLYDNLLTCLVRKYCKREGVDMPTEGLPTEVAEALLQLGKFALEALLRNETLLDLTEVQREKVNWKLLLKLGVVSLEVSSSKLHPRKQLNFSHMTMQEFLAGRYVAHALVKQDIVELLQLTSISRALELSNLLQFTCGCDSGAAQAVMEELSKMSSREFTHVRPEQFEGSHVPMDRDVKKSCQTYVRFASLCLTILSERQEPEVLQGISQTLPIVILDSSINSREATALKYYTQNLHSANLPDRLKLMIDEGTDSRDTVQYLQQCFTTSLPGLSFDLKLSGKFDSPDERLVSVMKNVPGLRALDLSNTHLTPSSLQTLVQGFSHMSLLEELDLSGNDDLGDAGMEGLQVGLSSVPHLAVLRLGYVGMTAVSISSLAPYMRHIVGLRELDISFNEIGDTGMESLTAVLPIFTAMQVLDLSAIGISPTGMRTLIPALCQLTRLIKLDISYNGIGDLGLECLAAILHHLTAMKVLDLKSTGISDRGISSLIKALPHLVQLQVLDVGGNNMGDSGIVSLVQTFCQPSSLDMEQNPPGDKSLTTAPHCNNTLQELNIGWNSGVTGAGLGRVAQLISALTALTRLDMSGYLPTPAHLCDTAAMALAEALPRLPALVRLYLKYISMEPAGFQAVVQAAEEHTTLEELWYSRPLVPEGVDTTASCLRLLP
ncbi:NLR family CARD domain-containing protein 3-like [Branchiostoma lanceolatum]|uniref:NLR family CARD domain-containing protein 3-like n=1 Tax=Branchiostoma lanceolatum TaxID=7740 RepID=UPI003456CEFE